VTRRTDLPTVEDVQLAIKELGETIGKPPTVLAVARRLGLANTTFRRNFPDLTANLQNPPSTTDSAADTAAVSRFDQLKRDHDKLRRDHHELAEHLGLAVANIQRLTLENHRLRQQLEAATRITHIAPKRRLR